VEFNSAKTGKILHLGDRTTRQKVVACRVMHL